MKRLDHLLLRFGLWLLPHTTRWRNANMSYTLNRMGEGHHLTLTFTDRRGSLIKAKVTGSALVVLKALMAVDEHWMQAHDTPDSA